MTELLQLLHSNSAAAAQLLSDSLSELLLVNGGIWSPVSKGYSAFLAMGNLITSSTPG